MDAGEIAMLEVAREALINGDVAAVTPRVRRVSRKKTSPKTVRRGSEVVRPAS